ncbi:hypothetical protein EVAR_46083_1 [Eumeta japonica]|uniref:Uncharacterized protein n=1 Tax=Eumeta variegata TaxID=151549 RepID=A0A4C1XHZ6_EUMVA|nr:hypothetical protein EVAR_46083_1 [Eumeta japonica]
MLLGTTMQYGPLYTTTLRGERHNVEYECGPVVRFVLPLHSPLSRKATFSDNLSIDWTSLAWSSLWDNGAVGKMQQPSITPSYMAPRATASLALPLGQRCPDTYIGTALP